MPHLEHSHPEFGKNIDDNIVVHKAPLVPDEVDFDFVCCVCGKKKTMQVDRIGIKFWKGKDLKFTCNNCEGTLAPSTTEYLHSLNKPKQQESMFEKTVRTWIPPVYQESDETRFPKAIWNQHREFATSSMGILFYGPPRTCKSRMAYQLAMFHAQTGGQIRCYDPRSFRAMIERNIEQKKLWDWYETDALNPFFLLDDIGKFKAEGRRIEEEIFNLIKIRHEHKLGIIVTSNCDGGQLASTFSPTIGAPVVERLREMCKPVYVGNAKAELTQETESHHVDPQLADL